jgi:hypothetical protein
MTETNDDRGDKIEGYFGLCPVCHKYDGRANAGRSHHFYCKEHKTSWCAGSNLFSDWRHQTEEEQRKIWDAIGLDGFADVEPYINPKYLAEEKASDGPPGIDPPDVVPF